MNRTNREQVVTRRDSVATTLQALELINGATLDRKLGQGAKYWHSATGKDRDRLVAGIFKTALGRAPTPPERQTALELLGDARSEEAVRDLLWTVVMLPEFQLIR
jgi:hypothetical protein